MRLCSRAWVVAAMLLAPMTSYAVTCTSQAELSPDARNALASAGARLAQAVLQQDFGTLHAALFPGEQGAWDGIQGAAEQAAPLLKGGHIQLRNLYLLDSSSQSAPADTEFFCSNATGSLTVTITLRALPPGKYGVVLADAAGAPMEGQMGIILAWEGGSSPGWTLAGLSVRQGKFDGHDGVWYWARGRELAKADPWSAWYCYEAARYLLVPVDFLSSPNLQRLDHEEEQIENSPRNAFPYVLHAGPRTWTIDALRLDPSLHHADLGIMYESTGVTDPAALRTEATSVMSALLKAQPGLGENFYGLWAYAMQDGKATPIMELPMGQIP